MEQERYVRLFDAMAEAVRQDAEKVKGVSQKKTLLGVAAGLEVAACALRDGAGEAETPDAVALMQKFQETHVAYLLQKQVADFHRRPPKLYVKKIVKGAGKKKQGKGYQHESK